MVFLLSSCLLEDRFDYSFGLLLLYALLLLLLLLDRRLRGLGFRLRLRFSLSGATFQPAVLTLKCLECTDQLISGAVFAHEQLRLFACPLVNKLLLGLLNLGSFVLFGHVFTYLLGSRRLFTLYFLGGITGGLTYLAVCKYAPLFQEKVTTAHPIHLLVGSYAVIVATMTFAPNFLFHRALLPMPTKYLGGILLMIPIIRLASRDVEAVAQLGSALFGYVYIHFIKYMAQRPSFIRKIQRFFRSMISFFSSQKVAEKNYLEESEKKPSAEELQVIFDKIASQGYQSLTDEEKEQLLNAS